jgi:hypothetical protein
MPVNRTLNLRILLKKLSEVARRPTKEKHIAIIHEETVNPVGDVHKILHPGRPMAVAPRRFVVRMVAAEAESAFVTECYGATEQRRG